MAIPISASSVKVTGVGVLSSLGFPFEFGSGSAPLVERSETTELLALVPCAVAWLL